MSPAAPAAPAAGSLPETITEAQIVAHLKCHPRTLRNWVKAGSFPKPVQLSSKRRVWPAAAVRAFLDAQAAGQAQPAGAPA